MIEKNELEKMYIKNKLSMMQISKELCCSMNKVAYWMNRHDIQRRSISEAVYQINNPNGDPFTVKSIETLKDAELFGLGIGLYWGEGNKANIHSLRLGNTDPALLRVFMKFLINLYGVKREDFRISLQIFTDIDPEKALRYWVDELSVEPSQFGKPTVTISGSIGTYRKKSEYGVASVSYHNKKLRDIIVGLLPR